jgi:hypothetical protein
MFMLRKSSRAVLVTITVAVIAASTATGARSALSLSLGQPDLQAGVLITVPVTVTCSPFDPSLTFFGSSAFVSVEQASRGQIARGTGSIGGPMSSNPIPFQCDGTPNALSVPVLADVNGPPFHGGQAALRASAGAFAGISCGPGCFFNVQSQTGNVGPVVLNMH